MLPSLLGEGQVPFSMNIGPRVERVRGVLEDDRRERVGEVSIRQTCSKVRRSRGGNQEIVMLWKGGSGKVILTRTRTVTPTSLMSPHDGS